MTKEFEEESIRRGYSRVYLHAREVAIEFYRKLGYEVFGEGFVEVGIPHRHMQKFISKTDEDISLFLTSKFQVDLEDAQKL